MLFLPMAAVIVSGIDARPATILGKDGQAGYTAKLQEKMESPALAVLLATAIPDCPSLTYSSTGYLELHNSDFGPTDEFYKTVAKEPALIEHLLAAGCGKTLQVNLMAVRLQSAPDDLKFTFQIVGRTAAGPLLQRDAYTYVALATNAARTLAGLTEPCTQNPMVYDTQVTVEPHNDMPWSETWYTSSCGFKAKIAIDFIPQPNGGTTISTHPMKPEEADK